MILPNGRMQRVFVAEAFGCIGVKTLKDILRSAVPEVWPNMYRTSVDFNTSICGTKGYVRVVDEEY